MRSLLALSAAALLLSVCATPAPAEQRIFIIANSPDGYGVDRCLADGAACGSAAANTYCQSKQFSTAAFYRKVDRGEITGAIPVSLTCGRNGCDEFVAIVCRR
jgi:hypothetical protein